MVARVRLHVLGGRHELRGLSVLRRPSHRLWPVSSATQRLVPAFKEVASSANENSELLGTKVAAFNQNA